MCPRFVLLLVAYMLLPLPLRGQAPPAKAPRTDRYGDPLPPGAVARLGTVRLRHGGGVCSLAFSPDGLVLASGSSACRLWSVTTGKELHCFRGHQASVSALAFSPDGKRLVSAGLYNTKLANDHTVRVWDVTRGRELLRLKRDEKSIGGTYATFSPDGKLLASGSDKTAVVWDAATGKERQRFTSGEGTIRSVVFSRDGRALALGFRKKTALIWDMGTGKVIRSFRGHKDSVRSVALSGDGATLATWGNDQTVRLWGAGTGKELRSLPGHDEVFVQLAFAADGKRLAAAASHEGVVHVWEVATGKEVCRLSHLGGVGIPVFSPDGKTLATAAGNQQIHLWTIPAAKERLFGGHEGGILAVAFQPGNKRVATAGRDGTERTWEAMTGKALRCSREDNTSFRCAAFSADGRRLAAVVDGKEPGCRLWDVERGKVQRFRGAKGYLSAIALVSERQMAGSRRIGGHPAYLGNHGRRETPSPHPQSRGGGGGARTGDDTGAALLPGWQHVDRRERGRPPRELVRRRVDRSPPPGEGPIRDLYASLGDGARGRLAGRPTRRRGPFLECVAFRP